VAELILHHYDFSNFSEKVRLIFGLKGLSWRSVEVPSTAPKPDFTPLTGGHRRAPALQIGAEIYADTAVIAEELERRFPTPSLYPGGDPARARALTAALATWAERDLLWPLARYITGLHADRFPESFHHDRAALHGKPAPTVEQVRRSAARNLAQALPHLVRVHDMVAGGVFLFGDRPGLADIVVYHPLWLLETIGGPSPLINTMPETRAWMDRVAAISHGAPSEMLAIEALDVAAAASPANMKGDWDDPQEGIALGDQVSISPLEERSAALGRLVAIDDRCIVIRATHDRFGETNVHFPRAGYRVRPND
jgi:glutathione S-transferase